LIVGGFFDGQLGSLPIQLGTANFDGGYGSICQPIRLFQLVIVRFADFGLGLGKAFLDVVLPTFDRPFECVEGRFPLLLLHAVINLAENLTRLDQISLFYRQMDQHARFPRRQLDVVGHLHQAFDDWIAHLR
jgi:hypothetical protein